MPVETFIPVTHSDAQDLVAAINSLGGKSIKATPQSLSASEKSIARSNIDVPSVNDFNASVNSIQSNLDTLSGDYEALSAGVSSISDNVTSLSEKMSTVQNGLAVIVDGDTCSVAVPAGGCAYIKNNTHGLTEGLYKNTSGSAFPVSGGSATSSVFTSVSGGLGSEIASLNSNIVSLNSALASFMNRFDSAFHQAPNDLNDAKESGFYLSTAGTNRPTQGWNIIIVARGYHDASGDVLVQIAYDVSGSGAFIRGCNGAIWREWKMISVV